MFRSPGTKRSKLGSSAQRMLVCWPKNASISRLTPMLVFNSQKRWLMSGLTSSIVWVRRCELSLEMSWLETRWSESISARTNTSIWWSIRVSQSFSMLSSTTTVLMTAGLAIKPGNYSTGMVSIKYTLWVWDFLTIMIRCVIRFARHLKMLQSQRLPKMRKAMFFTLSRGQKKAHIKTRSFH